IARRGFQKSEPVPGEGAGADFWHFCTRKFAVRKAKWAIFPGGAKSFTFCLFSVQSLNMESVKNAKCMKPSPKIHRFVAAKAAAGAACDSFI
ncbi:MAG: hypothetical protein LUB58_01275, partial [Oscillospiraceae bacterium]|nr:hypothetical protein [Oscillospiraceae bacterium]